MKKIQLIKTFIICALLVQASCKKEEKTSPANGQAPLTSSFFTAKVDGQAFPVADIQFTTAKFIPSTKMLQVTGQPTDRKETITLTLMPFGGKVTVAADWKPGTYDFDPVHVSNMEYLASAEYNKWNGNGYDQWFTKWEHVKTGKIIIESNSGTHIKGTFFFDAVRQNADGSYDSGNIKKITEGTFDLDIK